MKYDKRMYEIQNGSLIALDLDGVCFDWDGHAKALGLLAKNIDSFGYDFWSTIPLFPWAMELYESLKKIAPVVILTSPSNNPKSCEGKHFTITKHFKTRDFLIGGCKWACAKPNSILIDDSLDKIERFAMAGGKTALFKKEYGQNINKFIENVKYILNSPDINHMNEINNNL